MGGISRPRLNTRSQGSETSTKGRGSMPPPTTSRNLQNKLSITAPNLQNRRTSLNMTPSTGRATGTVSQIASKPDIGSGRLPVDLTDLSHHQESSTFSKVDMSSFSANLVSPPTGSSSEHVSFHNLEALAQNSIPKPNLMCKAKVDTDAVQERDNLHVKLRLMEKKRLEDRDKLKVLERLQQDKSKFEAVMEKLRAKYLPLQNDLDEARKQLHEAENKLQRLENIRAEYDSVVEMATLDRELAEESADSYRNELEVAKTKVEELQLENEILKAENEELSIEMSPEERTSKGWLQMEKENERLRQALLRLRELTQEQESELRNIVKSLEDEMSKLSGYKAQYEIENTNLLQAQADIEDLRLRLEAVLGAEDMIEELTDKNIVLLDRIEELQAAVEDLESLKELNDELEINHLEHEKQLQEVINIRDDAINEQARKLARQGDALLEQRYTINRFRDLTTMLQSELESMRVSKQISEAEANELTSKTKAIMDLNHKLQSSTVKGQSRTIDTELNTLEAEQAVYNLSIVQLYLPEEYVSDRESLAALLQFKRVVFKANLLHLILSEHFSDRFTDVEGLEEFATFEILYKLLVLSGLCNVFIDHMSLCTVEEFLEFKNVTQELDPVERTLTDLIMNLKKDELNKPQMKDDLQR